MHGLHVWALSASVLTARLAACWWVVLESLLLILMAVLDSGLSIISLLCRISGLRLVQRY